MRWRASAAAFPRPVRLRSNANDAEFGFLLLEHPGRGGLLLQGCHYFQLAPAQAFAFFRVAAVGSAIKESLAHGFDPHPALRISQPGSHVATDPERRRGSNLRRRRRGAAAIPVD